MEHTYGVLALLGTIGIRPRLGLWQITSLILYLISGSGSNFVLYIWRKPVTPSHPHLSLRVPGSERDRRYFGRLPKSYGFLFLHHGLGTQTYYQRM